MYAKILNFLETRSARRDERGASAVEYGLLIAGIAAVIVVAVIALGPVVKGAFTDTCTAMGETAAECGVDADNNDDNDEPE